MPLLGTAAKSFEPPAPLDVDGLYRAEGAFVGRVIQRLTGQGAHVEDILHETFLVALKKADTFDVSRAAPRTWLYGIAVRLCMRHARSWRRFDIFRSRLAVQPVADPDSPEQALERQLRLERLIAVVQRMPFHLRAPFVLYELEELSGKEVSALLDIPVGTVWRRLSDARTVFAAAARRAGGLS